MDVLFFCLFVGVGSTVILDVFVLLVEKYLKIPGTDWGVVGRWLLGLSHGQLVLKSESTSSTTSFEKLLGWGFHYFVGVSYAALIIIIYGVGFIENPTIVPALIVGLFISTLAGLMILMPGLGLGFMGRLVEGWVAMFAYLFIAHAIFSFGQYSFSTIYTYL